MSSGPSDERGKQRSDDATEENTPDEGDVTANATDEYDPTLVWKNLQKLKDQMGESDFDEMLKRTTEMMGDMGEGGSSTSNRRHSTRLPPLAPTSTSTNPPAPSASASSTSTSTSYHPSPDTSSGDQSLRNSSSPPLSTTQTSSTSDATDGNGLNDTSGSRRGSSGSWRRALSTVAQALVKENPDLLHDEESTEEEDSADEDDDLDYEDDDDASETLSAHTAETFSEGYYTDEAEEDTEADETEPEDETEAEQTESMEERGERRSDTQQARRDNPDEDADTMLRTASYDFEEDALGDDGDSCESDIFEDEPIKGPEWLSKVQDRRRIVPDLPDIPETHIDERKRNEGRDIQGIPWERLDFTRKQYRQTRLTTYRNYWNLEANQEDIRDDISKVRKDARFYDFSYTNNSVRPLCYHFQLRNLVCAPTKQDVFFAAQGHKMYHYSALTKEMTEVLSVAGTLDQPRVDISTICVDKGLAVIGGFNGEILVKNMESGKMVHESRISYDENSITNAIAITDSIAGHRQVLTSNNDNMVRIFDANRGGPLEMVSHIPFPWAVNHTSVSPDGRMLVGDDCDGLLADTRNGKTVASLKGHIDYSFASAFHPDGRVVATGNQDMTTRIWDTRMTSESLMCLEGHIGAVRSLHYSEDGRFLSMAEPADFVHIFDCGAGYSRSQVLDMFGEISGVAFSPGGESIFVGVADRTYGCVLEYSRREHGDTSSLMV